MTRPRSLDDVVTYLDLSRSGWHPAELLGLLGWRAGSKASCSRRALINAISRALEKCTTMTKHEIVSAIHLVYPPATQSTQLISGALQHSQAQIIADGGVSSGRPAGHNPGVHVDRTVLNFLRHCFSNYVLVCASSTHGEIERYREFVLLAIAEAVPNLRSACDLELLRKRLGRRVHREPDDE